ncbi:MAG: RrF2 family transcriptional regulator [Mangrovibacterium sp.]
MLSKTCKYALRAIIYIAKNCLDDQKIRIKEITEVIDVPAHFLAKILQNLAKSKIISSTKGPQGGFFIGKPLSEISIMQVIETVEGEEFLSHCLLKNEPCKCHQETNICCPLHAKFAPVKIQLINYYQQTSIQDIINDMSDHEHVIAM